MNARQRRKLRRDVARGLRAIGREDIEVTDLVALDVRHHLRQMLWAWRAGKVFRDGHHETRRARQLLAADRARRERYPGGWSR